MRALFTKPLTLEDLNTALQPMKDDIAFLKGDIAFLKDDIAFLKDDMTLLKESLLAPGGDQLAKDVTVVVYSEGATSVSCHGCLMRQNNDVYLLSAAHSIVDLTYGDKYSIKWSMHKDHELFPVVTFDRIHIPGEYVLKGSKDVGVARVMGNQLAEHLPKQTEWLQVSALGGGELVGKTVVGHGRVFLRGSVLSYPNDDRMMIGTPSVSGCSGCPLIDNDKNLVAFVHGGVKHRGGRVLHNNSGTDHVTGYLYADSVAASTLLLVKPAFYRILQIAEDIEDSLASKPADKAAYLNNATMQLKQAAQGALTLDEAMGALHRQIWSDAIQESDTITAGSHLELLLYQKPEGE